MGYLTDASYKQAQAEVYGQLTTSAVATGSQLVAFSGFSNSNYIREAYSADLDFGTGEWSASAWVNVPVSLSLASFPVSATNLFVAPLNVNGAWVNNGDGSFTNNTTVGDQVQKVGLSTAITGSLVQFTVTQGSVNVVNGAGEVIGNYGVGTHAVRFSQSGSYIGIRAASVPVTVSNITANELDSLAISHRAASSGASLFFGVKPQGRLTATAYDGTTTRTVTTDAAYNTGTWLKVRVNYQAGKLAILVNGVEVKSTVGAPLLSLSSRYNLFTRSEEFDHGDWAKTGVTVVANAAISPSGTSSADKLVTNNGSNALWYIQQIPSGLSGNLVYTLYAKAESATHIGFSTGAAGVQAAVNLTNGSVTLSGNSITVAADLNGWYRITMSVSGDRLRIFASTTAITVANQSVTGDGTSGILIWGAQLETGSTAKTYQRVGAASDFDFKAPLTIGNNYAATAPFPGSIALLKFSATVPSTEQSIWMYEQEKAMFTAGAQVTLPDANAIQDLAYDDLTDRWIAVSTTNKSTWSGLIRTASEAVSAGSYTKTSAASGIELVARSTTNPGVDITIPAYNVKARAKKKAEKSKKLTNATAIYDFTPVVFSNATLTNGSNVMTVTAANTSGTPYIGMGITGTGIAAGTTIVGIVSGTPNSYYLSAAYTGTTGSTYTVGQSTFSLPVGYTARLVYSGGLIQREGSTKAFTRAFDGFRETIVFGTSPGTSVVQIHAAKQ